MEGGTTQTNQTGPLRVMHVVYSLEPGGMEFGVVKLLNGFDRGRVRSSVCATTGGGRLKGLVAPDVRVFELSRRRGNDPRLVWHLANLFHRERPHIVHTHAWGTLLEGLVAARLARVPLVVHGEHGTLQLKPRQRWLQRWGWAHVDQVLSVSSVLATRIEQATGFPAERVETIRNGVDLQRFGQLPRAAARAALELPEGDFVVGTVGRLVPVKDQASLIDAVARIAVSHPCVRLVLAGDGPLRGELEAQAARLGVGGRVHFLGHRLDVETVLRALDVFALSSVSEGLSNTILEAMASGVPVVATRVGGAHELVQEDVTGLLVPPGDSRAFACALGILIQDADRRASMGAAARKRVETEFALSRMIDRYQEMYWRLARRRDLRMTGAE